MNDIERICDRIGILHGGKIALEESLDTLMKEHVQPVYDIEFNAGHDAGKIKYLLDPNRFELLSADDRKISVRFRDIGLDGGRLVRLIAEVGAAVMSLNLRRDSLEDIFLRVVNRNG